MFIVDLVCLSPPRNNSTGLGVGMMGVMTTQQLLPLAPAGAVLIGDAAALVADGDGGRVFIRGELCNAWNAGDDLGRRRAAVQLVRIKAARAMQVATAFGVATVTLWRWRKELDTGLRWPARRQRPDSHPSSALRDGRHQGEHLTPEGTYNAVM
jgi:hypothetical protein